MSNEDLIGKSATVPTSQIIPNEAEALRGNNPDDVNFKELVDAVKKNGVLSAISVRKLVDGRYEIIDGRQRWEAAKLAGFETMNVSIFNKTDEQVWASQIIANFVSTPTKKVEAAKQMKRLMDRDPTLPLATLAGKLSKTTDWVSKQLDLVKLSPKLAAATDNGELKLAVAYAISHLPEEEQDHYVDVAVGTSSTNEAVALIAARIMEIKNAKQKGIKAPEPEYVAKAAFRLLPDVKAKIEDPHINKHFKEALLWTIQLDDATKAEKKAAFEKSKADRKAKLEAAAKERADKKAAEVAKGPDPKKVVGLSV